MKITKKMLKNKHEIVTKLFLEKKKYKKIRKKSIEVYI